MTHCRLFNEKRRKGIKYESMKGKNSMFYAVASPPELITLDWILSLPTKLTSLKQTQDRN